MNTNHTPGTQTQEYASIISDRDYLQKRLDEEKAENAALLAALEGLYKATAKLAFDESTDDVMEDARTVIAQAKGETR